jgi:hypothetical protein
MATSHGRLTNLTVATKDISPYTKTSSYEKGADVHDTTGYGVADKLKAGGLIETKFTCGGVYDNTASTGPRNALHGSVGATLAIVRKVEGTGTGKPQDSFSAVLTKYVETSPVDDMVSWSAEFEVTGPVTTTTQP